MTSRVTQPAAAIRRWALAEIGDHLDRLASGDISSRLEAIAAIADFRQRWLCAVLAPLVPDRSLLVTEHLLHAIYDFDPRQGWAAAQKLEATGDPEHRTLAGLFLQGVPVPFPPAAAATAENTVATAGPIGPEVPQPLVHEDENPAVRADAAWSIARAAGPDAVDQLLRRLEDPSPGVLRTCLAAMAQLDPEAAIVQAGAVFRMPGNLFRLEAAAEFLVRDDRARIVMLQDAVADLPSSGKMAFARALVRWHPNRVLDLFEVWRSDWQGAEIVAYVLYELAAAEHAWPSPGSAARLQRCCEQGIALVEDSEPQVRASALVLLAEAGWDDWPDWARLLLGDHSEVVRLEALDLLDRYGRIEDRDELRRMLVDADRRVRERAFAALCRAAAPAEVAGEIQQLCNSPDSAMRQQAADFLAQWKDPLGHRLLMLLQRDRDVHVRMAALAAGFDAVIDPAEWLAFVRRKLGSRFVEIRAKALELLGQHGDAGDLRRIVARFKDEQEDVRRAAVEAVAKLAPEQAVTSAARMLCDPQRPVAETALSVLTRLVREDQRLEIVWQRLPSAQHASAELLIEHLQRHAPYEHDRLIAAAAQAPSDAGQLFAVREIGSWPSPHNLAVLKTLLAQGMLDARLEAIDRLQSLFPDAERKRLLIGRLEDREWKVRLAALERLAGDGDPQLLDPLLPLARDPDYDVRREAITALARFDDPRVFSELVSSLADVNGGVREVAHEILQGRRGDVPSVERIERLPGVPAWQWVRSQADAVNAWACMIGQELLGRPIEILNYRQGLGRTRPPADKDRPIEIEVNDYPVTSGHRFGVDIMKGLALHEIGHHLCDIGVPGDRTLRGIARSEGLGDIYDILADERLERVLRSRRRGWGTFFDRLASYAFAQRTHEVSLADYARVLNRPLDEVRAAVLGGAVPGRIRPADALRPQEAVELSDADMLVVPGLLPAMAAFIACLRCGFDPHMHPDPRIAKAVELVPATLKDLKHKHLLAIARKIGRVLGGSAGFMRDLRRMRRRLARSGSAGRAWDEVLDRMAEAGQLPQWARRGAAGIRKNPPSTPPRAPPLGGGSGRGFNSGAGQSFKPLEKEESIPFDPEAHARLVGPLRKHIRRLRAYIERLGLQTVEEHASRRGRRLDLARARSAALRRDPGMLVHSRDEVRPNAYLGLLIDRSGSMDGSKLDLAKAFGGLVAEATHGLRGLEGHVNAFDDSTFLRLGSLSRTSVASLESAGGNNDAGGLAKAAELAIKSGKRNKMLIMISDGSPTECTFESLRDLVTKLGKQQQVLCAQVAVDRLEQIAFPNFVNLSAVPFDEAIARFGALLIRLTKRWR
jgi:HEAT repeat protein